MKKDENPKIYFSEGGMVITDRYFKVQDSTYILISQIDDVRAEIHPSSMRYVATYRALPMALGTIFFTSAFSLWVLSTWWVLGGVFLSLSSLCWAAAGAMPLGLFDVVIVEQNGSVTRVKMENPKIALRLTRALYERIKKEED